MSIQIIDKPGSLSGRLGRAFGQGLAEQVPKEIERARLSSGLKSLEQEGSKLTPFQQAAKLYSTPGITPEMAGTLMQFLQQQNVLKEAQERRNQQPGVPVQGQGSGQAALPVEGQMQEPPGSQLPQLLKGTPEALSDEATRIQSEQPYRFPDWNSAYAEAEKRLGRQKEQIGTIENELEKALATKLQKPKDGMATYKDVLGDLQVKFRNRAVNDVLAGRMSETEAADKYSKEALDFAKSRQNLRTLGALSVLSENPKQQRDKINNIREKYKDLGQLEAFADDLIEFDRLSPAYAAHFAFPIQENKAINSYISSLKKRGTSAKMSRQKANEPEIADYVTKHLTPQDSILSILYALNKKDYDETKVLSEINKNYREGKLPNITERQKRELQNSGKIRPTFNDLFISAFSGE